METAPFRVLCAMTLAAGVSCLQLVQDRDGESARPLSDVFDEADRTALEAVSATLEGGTERQKNPHPPGSLPSPPGSAHAWAAGPDTTASQGPWSC